MSKSASLQENAMQVKNENARQKAALSIEGAFATHLTLPLSPRLDQTQRRAAQAKGANEARFAFKPIAFTLFSLLMAPRAVRAACPAGSPLVLNVPASLTAIGARLAR